MGLRLRAAGLHIPRSVLLRELGRVAEVTIAVLDTLMDEHVPGTSGTLREGDPPMEGDIEQRRNAMAVAQERRVATLVEAMGVEEAVREGRRRMAPVGERLGAEARERLGVGDSITDLVDAARVLYRVLGIDFEAEVTGEDTAVLHIHRCALSEGYSEVTCRLMSAADEGMVRGLNPRVTMTFRERITAGSPSCIADLALEVTRGGDDGGGAP